MGKILIISNRLPLQIKIENENVSVTPSVGGLATGMKSIYKSYDGSWIGWSGITDEEVNKDLELLIEAELAKESCVSVPLSESDINSYYHGFSNKTLWPLFHYFTEYAKYKHDYWEGYVRANQKFADTISKNIEGVDKIWIHDYQLLLLPKILKAKFPEITIGFFLHIPFPSSEVYRILPWRKEILEGILGADLIGFHTYDYERHFLSSVRRLLGYEINFNQITIDSRTILVDSFPMGIDYDKFHNASVRNQSKTLQDRSDVQKEIEKRQTDHPELRFILSIDRLDYTKGIANRLLAYEHFLKKNPEYKRKVTLIMLAVPSRVDVEQYQIMKSEIDELVGKINGAMSTISWSPIWYFYRSMEFDNLVDLYTASDIALITPIRDGMNLVAKEYVACKTNKQGVLILSELAGAAQELGEAIIINPNSFNEISDALIEALNKPFPEMEQRMDSMQKRLKRYNVNKWANDFMNSMEKIEGYQKKTQAKIITEQIKENLKKIYNRSEKRILFLDYDGTLVGFKDNPEDAKPDHDLYALLDKLASDEKNTLVLISGRYKNTFDKWFRDKPYYLIVEHGVWIKKPNSDWKMLEQINNDWKVHILPVLENFVDRTPGTFIEEKNYSLVWHYRKADTELSFIRANELKEELTSMVANNNLEIMEGNKVIEVKNAGVNKGLAALRLLGNDHYDFIFAAGDDWTDEYLFEKLPETAITVKVGMFRTVADYKLQSFEEIRGLLKDLLHKS